MLKRSWAGEVRNVSLLVAIGVNGEGYREILGICEGEANAPCNGTSAYGHPKRVNTAQWSVPQSAANAQSETHDPRRRLENTRQYQLP